MERLIGHSWPAPLAPRAVCRKAKSLRQRSPGIARGDVMACAPGSAPSGSRSPVQSCRIGPTSPRSAIFCSFHHGIARGLCGSREGRISKRGSQGQGTQPSPPLPETPTGRATD